MITLGLHRDEVEAIVDALEKPYPKPYRKELAEELRRSCGMCTRKQQEKNKRKRIKGPSVKMPLPKHYRTTFDSNWVELIALKS